VQAGGVELAVHRVAGELGADLGSDLLPSANVTSRFAPSMRTTRAPSARSRISIQESASLKNATCSKASGSKSASSPVLMTCRMFLLNSAVRPALSL
jgi:hypothetical protein